jgi:molybdopterin molybdotransferase
MSIGSLTVEPNFKRDIDDKDENILIIAIIYIQIFIIISGIADFTDSFIKKCEPIEKMLDVLTIAEVIRLIATRFGDCRMSKEQVSLDEALNRVLAEEIQAADYVPVFNRSTVDGYAVRASDVFGCSEAIPALLKMTGVSSMGEHIALQLEKGCCTYVPTGGEVPEGADAVVMIEHADDFGDGTIGVYKACAPGTNLIFKGDDVKPGKVVYPIGKMLHVADIGTLAALGVTKIMVRKKPRVALISTGDELVQAGEPVMPGKIRDVNGPMLYAAILESRAQPDFLGILQDDMQEIKRAMSEAVKESDMLILTGGTSVGLKDTIPEALSTLGEMLVHGIASKPGKPTIFGVIEDKPVFGLSGNPLAAFFMFLLLVKPLLHSMQGIELVTRSRVVPISRAVPSNHGREDLIPVALKKNQAIPIIGKSGLITTLSGADGYIRIARDIEGINQGENVEVFLF